MKQGLVICGNGNYSCVNVKWKGGEQWVLNLI